MLESIAPISTKGLKQIYNQVGPKEGNSKHKNLKTKSGFWYLTLLGEMILFAYVTCRSDIGYAITLLSKGLALQNTTTLASKMLQGI